MSVNSEKMRIFSLVLCVFVFIILSDSTKGNDEEELLFKSAKHEFTKHAIIEPRIHKKTSDTQGDYQDEIIIQFSAFSKNFTLDLKRTRNLFSKSYVETSISSKGEDINRPATDEEARCFYHGRIRDHLSSMVALSTCDGISHLKESYHLEPALDIGSASHRLYKDSDMVIKNRQRGTHPGKVKDSRHLPHRRKREALIPVRRDAREIPVFSRIPRFVEMYIVNDLKTFESNGRNLTRQIQRTKNIINIVNILYRPLNIFITLAGIENWTLGNMFAMEPTPMNFWTKRVPSASAIEADETLENFLRYRRSKINPVYPNDNAQLITGTHFKHGVVGKAIKGTICTNQYSGGVNMNLATEGQTATLIAHMLGHNLGMDHDRYPHCRCTHERCIMAPTRAGQWSSCSIQTLQEQFDIGMDYCLLNEPDDLSGVAVCGNGLTEKGEECDCGLPQDCVNNCCNVSTCKLKAESKCATGVCCDLNTCQPMSAATSCRPSVGECDLPEFCSGDSEYCPDDVYLQDGVECNGGQSYCYNGQCKTHTSQCQLLWGTTGHESERLCFEHLNTKGSRNGNCGYNWTTSQYLSCSKNDVMCGLLHCDHQSEKLIFWKDTLALATSTTFLTVGPKSYKCSGVLLDVGLNMPDPGMVPDGAKCGEGKMCVNQRCTSLSSLRLSTCQNDCSGKGVCNSRGHCHCDEGLAPPTCNSSGHGGNVDSGPAKIPDCGKNYSLAHGTVNYISDMTSYKQSADVTCDEGYQIEGDPVITCQADGAWSDNTSCRPKPAEECSQDYSLAYGTVKYTGNMTSYNQTAVVTCDEGYEIEGDREITCQADGTWSDNTTCRAKHAEGTFLRPVSDNSTSTAVPNRAFDIYRVKNSIVIYITLIIALVQLMFQG